MIIGNSPAIDRLKAVQIVAKDGEYFIKCLLVLLAVRFSILGDLGLPAIGVAWGASPVALLSSCVIGRKFFKMDMEVALLIAVGATWCGASAISAVGKSRPSVSSHYYSFLLIVPFHSIPTCIFIYYVAAVIDAPKELVVV